jgi:hypothetical protein
MKSRRLMFSPRRVNATRMLSEIEPVRQDAVRSRRDARCAPDHNCSYQPASSDIRNAHWQVAGPKAVVIRFVRSARWRWATGIGSKVPTPRRYVLQKGQQVGIDRVCLSGRHAMRKALIDAVFGSNRAHVRVLHKPGSQSRARCHIIRRMTNVGIVSPRIVAVQYGN